MPARGEHRIKKLESVLLGNLTPKDRVRMLLSAAAEGDKDQARRIAQACPMVTYRMANDAYVTRLEDAHALYKAGFAILSRYTFACQAIEGVKDFLSGNVAHVLTSQAAMLSVCAIVKDFDDNAVDWNAVDAAEEEASVMSHL